VNWSNDSTGSRIFFDHTRKYSSRHLPTTATAFQAITTPLKVSKAFDLRAMAIEIMCLMRRLLSSSKSHPHSMLASLWISPTQCRRLLLCRPYMVMFSSKACSKLVRITIKQYRLARAQSFIAQPNLRLNRQASILHRPKRSSLQTMLFLPTTFSTPCKSNRTFGVFLSSTLQPVLLIVQLSLWVFRRNSNILQYEILTPII
jgi:hypothetical protein